MKYWIKFRRWLVSNELSELKAFYRSELNELGEKYRLSQNLLNGADTRIKELEAKLPSDFKFLDAGDWSEVNRKDLLTFLASETGMVFAKTLRNMTFKHNATAVNAGDKFEWRCGRAAGYQLAVQTVEYLTGDHFKKEIPSQEDSTPGEHGDSGDLLGRLSP